MKPGDRMICIFVNDIPIGTTFTEWPLHVTIVPWFRLDTPSSDLAKQLQKHYIGSKPFQINVLQETQLGYKKRKTVNSIEAAELNRLEGQTRRLLHSYKTWIVDEADKTRKFHPHITAQKSNRIHEGDIIKCDRLYVISQHGDFKQIDSEVIL